MADNDSTPSGTGQAASWADVVAELELEPGDALVVFRSDGSVNGNLGDRSVTTGQVQASATVSMWSKESGPWAAIRRQVEDLLAEKLRQWERKGSYRRSQG